MTSAPVKDVSSLMNFVGNVGTRNLKTTGGMNSASGFGDAMSKAQGETTQTDSSKQIQPKQETPQTAAETVQKRPETVKPQATEKAGEQEDVSAESLEAMEEAGQEMVKDIANELGVTQEEVEQAMEELGLSIFSLFDPAQLTQLVLQVTGEPDAAVLLTDETLFGSLQDLMSLAENAKAGLTQEMNVNPEELQVMLQEAEQMGQMEQTAETETIQQQSPDENTAKTPPIVVEVEQNGETVKLSADENGNVEKTLDVETQKPEKAPTEQEPGKQGQGNSGEHKSSSESEFSTGNQLLDALLQNKTQTAEVSFEQTGGVMSQNTQDIMNQIMDYMKIQLKPDMNQLEMQLHPESLGTVHVQLTNKGGEVTAQFHVQNETVKAAIESQIVDLKESLKDQGVKVEAVEVTVENHGFESNLWQGQGREENASAQNNKKTPRRINLNELDGLFEEEASEEEILTAKMMEVNGNTVDYTA